MTNEERQLLLQDLCSRLPYGVQIYCEKGESKFNFTLYGIRGKMLISKITYEEKTYSKGIVSKHYEYPIYSSFLKIICKPYLRPISSMTEEEKKEFTKVLVKSQECSYENNESATTIVNDWYLSKGFDVRGLIPKGLALPAKEGMYNN